MKKMSILLCSLVVVGAAAQQVLAEDSRESQLSNRLAKASSLSLSEGKTDDIAVVGAAAQQVPAGGLLESQLSDRLAKVSLHSLSEGNPNEIVKGNFAYSGIAVAAFKTDNPLQLASPFAPARYGSGLDNVLRDLKTGGVSGWKLFSIGF
ncbi:MAG: hypothetical protein WCQ21_37515 [Verrucomicrobiota bacterium]|jgi:hypothetical protein